MSVSPRPALPTLECPACGTVVMSPTLTTSEMLDRHLTYCRWEPEGFTAP